MAMTENPVDATKEDQPDGENDIARLRGERWQLERMLEKLPADRVIDRLGLEERLAVVEKELAGSELLLQPVPQHRSDTEQKGST